MSETALASALRQRGRLSFSRPSSPDVKKSPLRRWQNAVSAVLGEESRPKTLDRKSMLGKVASYVALPQDEKDDQKRKASLALIAVGCAMGGVVVSLQAFALYGATAVLIPLLFSASCFVALRQFVQTKQENRMCTTLILLLFILPKLFCVIYGSETGTGAFAWMISQWSFLSAFGAVVWTPKQAVSWFGACLASHLALVLISSFISETISTFAFYQVQSMTIYSLLFFSARHHARSFEKSQRKLKSANAFLRTHNKELTGEKDYLKEEMIKLQRVHSDEELMNSPSKAEKIIKIMQKLKDNDGMNEFGQDIEFVIKSLGAGGDLYFPDMSATLEKNNKMDSSIKFFLLSHNNSVSFSNLHHHADHHTQHHDHHEEHHHEPLTLLHSEQAENLLGEVNVWNFEIFRLAEITKRPLYYMGQALFRSNNLIKKFNIDPEKLDNFLHVVEESYHPENPYHNAIHASDVAQSLNFLLNAGGIGQYLSDVDILAAIVAALIHDIDHTGYNNNFEVLTLSRRALVHNDISVLENHHLATAFEILQNPANDVFSGLSNDIRRELRSTIIEMVLATDFSKHLEVLGQYKSRRAAGGFSGKNREDRILLLKMALKCADISHASKSTPLHLTWTQRVTDEFYLQGDREKELGLPISALMDRVTGNIAKSQTGFISFLVLPLFEALELEFPATEICMRQLQGNLLHWKTLPEKSS
eukprot:TRINITY_DN1367_c0_g1_i1.p1 TRINITY_DN1367_c0_g1~~TRINITY_DN1367_c0_g1_i1.p1  ORF type:complete len:704 (-),score=174.95 TRINITY_DN1367_c0_g1_i1:33-2144(-)